MAKNSPSKSGSNQTGQRTADNRVSDHNYASRKLQSKPYTQFLNEVHEIERKALGAKERK